MATPALPPELAGLHDIVLPEPISYVPATIGWVVVATIVGVAVVWLGARRVQRWRADAYRRRALEEFARLEALLDRPETRGQALASFAPLVKRTALAFLPREEVASLSGESWLRVLDETGEGAAFLEGPGRILEDVAFRGDAHREAVPADEARALGGAVGAWLRDHRRPTAEAVR